MRLTKRDADSRAYENAEDPLHVLENNLPIDTRHYLENQLSKPLMRIFEPILGDKANSLRKSSHYRFNIHCLCHYAVAGDHTRTVTIATPTSGGLMGFVKKTLTCLGCRSPLTNISKSGSKFLDNTLSQAAA